jgi:hypothetical protein
VRRAHIIEVLDNGLAVDFPEFAVCRGRSLLSVLTVPHFALATRDLNVDTFGVCLNDTPSVHTMLLPFGSFAES